MGSQQVGPVFLYRFEQLLLTPGPVLHDAQQVHGIVGNPRKSQGRGPVNKPVRS
jgi:hypothetical protein